MIKLNTLKANTMVLRNQNKLETIHPNPDIKHRFLIVFREEVFRVKGRLANLLS